MTSGLGGGGALCRFRDLTLWDKCGYDSKTNKHGQIKNTLMYGYWVILKLLFPTSGTMFTTNLITPFH